MFSNPEKLSAASKALFESQLAAFTALAGKAVDGGQKAIALNIAAAKTAAEESAAAAQQLLASKDPQGFFALAAAQAKANADKAATFGQQLTDILSGVNADITKTAEAQLVQSQSRVAALVDEVIENAPAGSDSAVAMLKSMLSNANASLAQASTVHQQSVDALQAQVAKAAGQFTQAAKKSS